MPAGSGPAAIYTAADQFLGLKDGLLKNDVFQYLIRSSDFFAKSEGQRCCFAGLRLDVNFDRRDWGRTQVGIRTPTERSRPTASKRTTRGLRRPPPAPASLAQKGRTRPCSTAGKMGTSQLKSGLCRI